MFGINRVIQILITSDFFLQAGWGLSGPIFAIFLTKQIQGGTLEMVGFIAATYWITKSIVQPFIAKQLDKNHGEKDDFIFLVAGMYVANLIPLGYIFSNQLWHIFVLEFIRGLAMACVVPTWSGIFTRHIDKGREAFSWSLESTGIGFAAGLAGAFGGFLASTVGFYSVFILVSAFGIISSSTLLLIRKQIFLKNVFAPRLPPTEKPF
jgi:predicted MFS family arabinose efflux permease